jgi:hypothetical protein
MDPATGTLGTMSMADFNKNALGAIVVTGNKLILNMQTTPPDSNSQSFESVSSMAGRCLYLILSASTIEITSWFRPALYNITSEPDMR